jgi:hypothetical protein
MSPPEQVRLRLERLRADGVPFGAAWPMALRGLRWQSGKQRNDWKGPLEETREGWRRAYEGEPGPLEALIVDRANES